MELYLQWDFVFAKWNNILSPHREADPLSYKRYPWRSQDGEEGSIFLYRFPAFPTRPLPSRCPRHTQAPSFPEHTPASSLQSDFHPWVVRYCRAHTSEFRNSTGFQPVIAVMLEELLLSPSWGSDGSSGNWAGSLIISVSVNGIFIGTWAFDFGDVKHTVPLSRERSWTIIVVKFSSNRSVCADHLHRWCKCQVPPTSSVQLYFWTAACRVAEKEWSKNTQEQWLKRFLRISNVSILWLCFANNNVKQKRIFRI